MKEIKPLNDKILVQLVPEEETTNGGLYIPDTVRDEQTKGIVKAVGTGIELSDGTIRPIPLKEGDMILFVEGKGIDIKLENDVNKYKIINIRDVLSIIIE